MTNLGIPRHSPSQPTNMHWIERIEGDHLVKAATIEEVDT